MVSIFPYYTQDQGIACQRVLQILLVQRTFPAADTECVGPGLSSHAAPVRARPAEEVGFFSIAFLFNYLLFSRFFDRLSLIHNNFCIIQFIVTDCMHRFEKYVIRQGTGVRATQALLLGIAQTLQECRLIEHSTKIVFSIHDTVSFPSKSFFMLGRSAMVRSSRIKKEQKRKQHLHSVCLGHQKPLKVSKAQLLQTPLDF